MHTPPNLNRRTVLAGSIANGMMITTGLCAQTTDGPIFVPSNMKVTITTKGATYTYPSGPKLPSYYVGFHQDGNILFHLGALGDLTKADNHPAPYNMGIYHVKIEKDGTVLLDVDIRSHWWNAEWTYRPAPFAIKKTPAQIVAENLMFPFGDIGAKVANVTAPDYTPMGSSSITLYMPTTGERADIGLLSDPSAHFMLTGNAGPMLAWAQCAASCPVHFRDESTGKPISLLKYPKANCYPDSKSNQPWLAYGAPKTDGSGYLAFGGGWTPQQAHYCEFGSYLAFLATHDTGFLEDLQYSANFTTGICDAYISTDKMTLTYGELRGMAWAFRNLFMVHTATKYAESLNILPVSCHPSSYWKTLLDNQLAHQIPCMTDPTNQTFRLFGGGNRFGPWQVDYMLESVAFGILTGHSNWTDFWLWMLGNVIARTNGTSGYPPGYGVGYYMNRLPWKRDAQGKPMSGTFDFTAAPMDWAQSALYCMSVDPDGSPLSSAQIAKLKADPLNGGVAMSLNESMMTTRSVLVMAAHLERMGLVKVKHMYPELDTCIFNADRMVRSYGSVNPRASIILQKT